MVADLLIVLVLILCSGVGVRVVTRLRSELSSLGVRVSLAEQACRRLDTSVDLALDRTEATHDALFAHECKPSTAAHSPVLVKKVAKKAAPVKKAAAKKAPVRTR